MYLQKSHRCRYSRKRTESCQYVGELLSKFGLFWQRDTFSTSSAFASSSIPKGSAPASPFSMMFWKWPRRSGTCRRRSRSAGVSCGPATARSGKLDRARSRLYRGQILQQNMRLKALAEIYTMHSFAQLCNLNFLSKFCQKLCQILQNSANLARLKVSEILKFS